jgi:hypothetical protein
MIRVVRARVYQGDATKPTSTWCFGVSGKAAEFDA